MLVRFCWFSLFFATNISGKYTTHTKKKNRDYIFRNKTTMTLRKQTSCAHNNNNKNKNFNIFLIFKDFALS